MAYWKTHEFEVSIPAADLKPGMRVCVPRKITYGWNNYTGLTYYRPFTIKRVTPKKTKVICEDGTGPGKYGVDTDRLCARAKAYCESGRSEFGDRKRAESEAQ